MFTKCISQRAADFQGFESTAKMETLQVTRYEEGQQYKPHFDWTAVTENNESKVDRISTFFVTLEANCTTCGTSFPRLQYDWEQEDIQLCRYVECGQSSLVVKPIPGSALFWRNIHQNGTGDILTLHAGLPVKNGIKVGLNIWTQAIVSSD